MMPELSHCLVTKAAQKQAMWAAPGIICHTAVSIHRHMTEIMGISRSSYLLNSRGNPYKYTIHCAEPLHGGHIPIHSALQ